MKLVFQEALITSVSNRGENHGDEVVPAHTIAFKAQCPLGILKEFKPGLRDMLFTAEKEPIPRIVEIGTLRWKPEYEGAGMDIAEREFFEVGLKKVTITPLASGVVEIAGNLNVACEDEETSGFLARLVNQTVKITLTKLTQKTIEEAEEEEEDSQLGLPGTEKITKDGTAIVPLQH